MRQREETVGPDPTPSHTPPATHAAAPRTSPDEPLPRRGIVFAIASVALFMAALDQTIVATALPAIQHDLGTEINWSGWTITIYSLGQIVVMPLAGRISDQYGRKKVFLVAAAIFTIASLCCSMATNVWLLVGFRALQAVGGGAFMPSATGIVSDIFGRGRDRAIGMLTSVFPIGGITGPVVGGVIVTYWSWREIFLVNVPAGVLLIVLGMRLIPTSRRRPASRPDVPGIVLLAVFILTAMFGIARLGNGTVSLLDPAVLVAEAVAVVMAVLFARHTKRAATPFIPIRLLRGKGFGVMNGINLLYGGAALGFGALVPVYAHDRFQLSTLEAGTLLTARAVGTICVTGLAVLALRRIGVRLPMVVGFSIIAVGLVAMALYPHWVSPYVWLSITTGVTGVGMGLSVPASNNATLQLAPEQVAAITGLRGMFRQSGAIIGVSVTTAILARSHDPGLTQAHVFIAFAVVLACVLPLVRLVPDHRGTW
ncbi:MAG: MFS transporter [Acidothermales bacterium]|nr:MFS transporter [Acidothermales bacterium]